MSLPGQTVSRAALWRNPAEQASGGSAPPVHQGDPRDNIPSDAAVVDRREFLTMMNASVAAAALSGCGASQPAETIVPYVQSPEQIVPGRPLFFATAIAHCGRTMGVLVESHMGRPTKIEGNPLHPASLGATDAITQASVASLYDPDRSQAIRHLGEISTWNAFLTDLRSVLAEQVAKQGTGLRILTGSVVSPTLSRQIDDLRRKFPKARWHQYESGRSDSPGEAARRQFGRVLDSVYHFDRADVVVSLDADFLGALNGGVRYARDFLSRRNLVESPGGMNRLYCAETGVTNTGAAADHRLPLRPSEILSIARRLARLAGVPGSGERLERGPGESDRWIAAAAEDLAAHRGKGLVLAGERQPWEVHAIARLLNRHFQNVGQTIEEIEPVEFEPVSHVESLRELGEAIDRNEVELLVIIDTNPVATAPADFELARRLRSISRMVVHLGEYDDETAEFCHWHIPQTHALEAWSDARAYDGTVTIAQPLIAPLFGGKSPHELLSAVIDDAPLSPYEAVRATWKSTLLAEGRETAWTNAVHDGVVAGTRHEGVSMEIADLPELWIESAAPTTDSATSLELAFDVDPTIGDGRFANNGWLQELPKPWTRLTWGNAFLMSPASAAAMSLQEGEVIEVRAGDRAVEGPVSVVSGHPTGCATVHLGHGRKRGGKIAAHGFDASPLRTSANPWSIAKVEMRKVGRRERLACTQTHGTLEGRDEAIFRRLRFEEFSALLARGESDSKDESVSQGTEAGHGHAGELPTLYPDYAYPDRAWGMAIDLTRCTGCNACVVACQIENNVPVVGKTGVLIGREMHWLRIDRYFAGEPENPEVLQQPMMCQHCEHAPCEVVCPVAATTHSSEGLNEMTYNRCVGTRYCSNNCPYKVRRFNFLRYTEDDSSLAMLRANPDVTVRSRGVMEKCTYCVQRINAARIEASIRSAHDGRPLRIADGAIETACQAVCPAKAIQFGDINDKESGVARWREQPHAFGVLAELGTRPRTTYLSRVTNPSQRLAGSSSANGTFRPHATEGTTP